MKNHWNRFENNPKLLQTNGSATKSVSHELHWSLYEAAKGRQIKVEAVFAGGR